MVTLRTQLSLPLSNLAPISDVQLGAPLFSIGNPDSPPDNSNPENGSNDFSNKQLILEVSSYKNRDLNDIVIDTSTERLGSFINGVLILVGECVFRRANLKSIVSGFEKTPHEERLARLQTIAEPLSTLFTAPSFDAFGDLSVDYPIMRLSRKTISTHPHYQQYRLFLNEPPLLLVYNHIYSDPKRLKAGRIFIGTYIKNLRILLHRTYIALLAGDKDSAQVGLTLARASLIRMEVVAKAEKLLTEDNKDFFDRLWRFLSAIQACIQNDTHTVSDKLKHSYQLIKDFIEKN